MRLRVIDFGTVPALRSQAVYHGLAETITAASDPILSLVSPADPYVCIGLHQDIDREVDRAYCAAHGLPIIRRQVGGGTVYLDHGQLFTHFIYPQAKAPQFAVNLYPRFIEPVVRTYRDLGIPATYRPVNDIQVNGRKIGGTGAASIGEATVMVGSFMFDFDIATMSRCLRVPSEKFRDKLHQTLADYITTMTRELATPPSRDDVVARFLTHCAEVLGVTPEPDGTTPAEEAAIAAAEARLADPDWSEVQSRKLVALGVKIAADTHLTEAAHKAPGGLIRVNLLEREGRVADLVLSGDFTCLPPDGIDRLAAGLTGVTLDRAPLETAIGAFLGAAAVETPGITPADFATAILAAKAD
ncbi:MAG: lipoate--protein ligase family protein [Paracoccaceae bacterium]|nr:lipoate--protein ligase family protein [Paracoccaceae bacterium]